MSRHDFSIRQRVRNRAALLADLLADDPTARACRHCGSPIRPLPRDPRAWVHCTTNLLRCVGTDEVQLAAPTEEEQTALPLIGTEAA